VSDNLDGRAILASLPAHVSHVPDVDAPLAILPCLRLDHAIASEGIWVE